MQVLIARFSKESPTAITDVANALVGVEEVDPENYPVDILWMETPKDEILEAVRLDNQFLEKAYPFEDLVKILPT